MDEVVLTWNFLEWIIFVHFPRLLWLQLWLSMLAAFGDNEHSLRKSGSSFLFNLEEAIISLLQLLRTDFFSRVSAARHLTLGFQASIALLGISPLQLHNVKVVLILRLTLHRIRSQSAHLRILGKVLISNVSPVDVVINFNIVCSCLSLHSTILIGFGRAGPLMGLMFTSSRRRADEIAECACCHIPDAGEWGRGSLLTKLHLRLLLQWGF